MGNPRGIDSDPTSVERRKNQNREVAEGWREKERKEEPFCLQLEANRNGGQNRTGENCLVYYPVAGFFCYRLMVLVLVMVIRLVQYHCDSQFQGLPNPFSCKAGINMATHYLFILLCGNKHEIDIVAEHFCLMSSRPLCRPFSLFCQILPVSFQESFPIQFILLQVQLCFWEANVFLVYDCKAHTVYVKPTFKVKEKIVMS